MLFDGQRPVTCEALKVNAVHTGWSRRVSVLVEMGSAQPKCISKHLRDRKDCVEI
jgi:hypothetical protein